MNLPIPVYCEQIIEGIIAEPFNAISNIAFILSGICSIALLKKYKAKSNILWFLPFNIFSIGLGSTLWHTYRTPPTLIMDSIPIYVFIVVVLYLLLNWLLKNKNKAAIVTGSFVLFQTILWLILPSNITNSSIRHIINLAAFSCVLYFLRKKNGTIPKEMWYAFILYFSAIIARTVDLPLCSYFMHGTHMIWHILNAAAVYFAVKMLLVLKIGK